MERKTAYATILALLVVGGMTGVTGAIPTTDGPDLTAAVAADDDATNETEMGDDDSVDDSRNLTVSLSDARDTADGALSSPPEGEWRIVESKLHETDGYYEFEYSLDSTDASGEAEVRVDGSTGDAFRLEEEIEPDDGAEREREYNHAENETEDDEDEQEKETEDDENEQENETEDDEDETEDETEEDETENGQEDETENEAEDDDDEIEAEYEREDAAGDEVEYEYEHESE